MKIGFDKEKSSQALADIVQGTVAFGKKAASSAKANVLAAVEKNQTEGYNRRLKNITPFLKSSLEVMYLIFPILSVL